MGKILAPTGIQKQLEHFSKSEKPAQGSFIVAYLCAIAATSKQV